MKSFAKSSACLSIICLLCACSTANTNTSDKLLKNPRFDTPENALASVRSALLAEDENAFMKCFAFQKDIPQEKRLVVTNNILLMLTLRHKIQQAYFKNNPKRAENFPGIDSGLEDLYSKNWRELYKSKISLKNKIPTESGDIDSKLPLRKIGNQYKLTHFINSTPSAFADQSPFYRYMVLSAPVYRDAIKQIGKPGMTPGELILGIKTQLHTVVAQMHNEQMRKPGAPGQAGDKKADAKKEADKPDFSTPQKALAAIHAALKANDETAFENCWHFHKSLNKKTRRIFTTNAFIKSLFTEKFNKAYPKSRYKHSEINTAMGIAVMFDPNWKANIKISKSGNTATIKYKNKPLIFKLAKIKNQWKISNHKNKRHINPDRDLTIKLDLAMNAIYLKHIVQIGAKGVTDEDIIEAMQRDMSKAQEKIMREYQKRHAK